jgi:hypothetical protein
VSRRGRRAERASHSSLETQYARTNPGREALSGPRYVLLPHVRIVISPARSDRHSRQTCAFFPTPLAGLSGAAFNGAGERDLDCLNINTIRVRIHDRDQIAINPYLQGGVAHEADGTIVGREAIRGRTSCCRSV